MPWVRFDDQFPDHPKVAGLSDGAYRLHSCAIHWSARYLQDGVIHRDDLPLIRPQLATPDQFAAECVKRDVWHHAGYVCDSPKCPAYPGHSPTEAKPKQAASRLVRQGRSKREAGFVIHDYFDYQPSRKKVLEQRSNRAEAGRLGGLKSGQSRRSATRKAKPKQGASRLVRQGRTPVPVPTNPPYPPDPPQAGGCPRHTRPRQNCAECAKGPPALRHPSARSVQQAIADATPNGQATIRQESPMIQPATPELLNLAQTMRPDWDTNQLAGALAAAHNAGWTWTRTLHATVLLLIAEKATPHDLLVAARSPVARTGDRGDYDQGLAMLREAFKQAVTP